MTQSHPFLQITALLVSFAALALILSSQTYQQRSRFKDTPPYGLTVHQPDVSAARGLRPSSQISVDPLNVSASRARN